MYLASLAWHPKVRKFPKEYVGMLKRWRHQLEEAPNGQISVN